MKTRKTTTIATVTVVSVVLLYFLGSPPLILIEMKRQMLAGTSGPTPGSYHQTPYQKSIEVITPPAVWLSEIFPPYESYCQYWSDRIFD